jgi:CheY-like chemotaxis protein
VIVDKHEGSIEFETVEGEGTTFVIRLPHDGESLRGQAAARRSGFCLWMMRAMCAMVFGRCCMVGGSRGEMHFVASGEATREACEEGKFDVVVTDMRMPGMGGATLLGHLRERFPDTVRLILSGTRRRRRRCGRRRWRTDH